MSTTAQEVYAISVRSLSPIERLRLAALILDDLTLSNVAIVDNGEIWSAQDEKDLMTLSLRYADSIYPEGKSGSALR